MAAFAAETEVPVSKTRGEIEALVERHGAQNFGSGWIKDHVAGISFGMRGRVLRFQLVLPQKDDATKALRARGGNYRGRARPNEIPPWIDKETRRRWRCLLLAIKGKLEAVQAGITEFDEEFLAHIVTDNNLTMYERIKVATTRDGQRVLPPVEAPAAG